MILNRNKEIQRNRNLKNEIFRKSNGTLFILINFHMTLIDTFKNTSGYRDGPQDSLREKKWQNSSKKSELFNRQITQSRQ